MQSHVEHALAMNVGVPMWTESDALQGSLQAFTTMLVTSN